MEKKGWTQQNDHGQVCISAPSGCWRERKIKESKLLRSIRPFILICFQEICDFYHLGQNMFDLIRSGIWIDHLVRGRWMDGGIDGWMDDTHI